MAWTWTFPSGRSRIDHLIPMTGSNSTRWFLIAWIRSILDLIAYADLATTTNVQVRGPVFFAHVQSLYAGCRIPPKEG